MVPGVLGWGFDIQTPLADVWTNLKNRVYGNQITISFPLPDAFGNVDLSIDTSTLDSTQVGGAGYVLLLLLLSLLLFLGVIWT